MLLASCSKGEFVAAFVKWADLETGGGGGGAGAGGGGGGGGGAGQASLEFASAVRSSMSKIRASLVD